MNSQRIRVIAVLLVSFLGACGTARGASEGRLFVGADISMLPELEEAGATYRHEGKESDALRIFRDHGFNLFRVRLFVNPTSDFNSSWGATQDLDYVRALAKRVKSSGATFLLDIHYSDTWADPGKQTTPAAWKDLSFDALEKTTIPPRCCAT